MARKRNIRQHPAYRTIAQAVATGHTSKRQVREYLRSHHASIGNEGLLRGIAAAKRMLSRPPPAAPTQQKTPKRPGAARRPVSRARQGVVGGIGEHPAYGAVLHAVRAGVTTRRTVREFLRAKGIPIGNARLNRAIDLAKQSLGMTRGRIAKLSGKTLLGKGGNVTVLPSGADPNPYRYVVEVRFLGLDKPGVQKAIVSVVSRRPMTKKEAAEAGIKEFAQAAVGGTTPNRPEYRRIIGAVVRAAFYNPKARYAEQVA